MHDVSPLLKTGRCAGREYWNVPPEGENTTPLSIDSHFDGIASIPDHVAACAAIRPRRRECGA
jgi:hypothetical protein